MTKKKNTKQKPFRVAVGDRFQTRSGNVWIVTERGLFGRPHWVISEDRNRQTLMHSRELARLKRLEPCKLNVYGMPDWSKP